MNQRIFNAKKKDVVDNRNQYAEFAGDVSLNFVSNMNQRNFNAKKKGVVDNKNQYAELAGDVDQIIHHVIC